MEGHGDKTLDDSSQRHEAANCGRGRRGDAKHPIFAIQPRGRGLSRGPQQSRARSMPSGAPTLLAILVLAAVCADQAASVFPPSVIHQQPVAGGVRVAREGGLSPSVLQQLFKKRVEHVKLWEQPTMTPSRLGQLQDRADGIRCDLSMRASKLASSTIAAAHVKQVRRGPTQLLIFKHGPRHPLWTVQVRSPGFML